MVDQSERAFRLLCRRHGVDLAYTPMLHAEPFAADVAYRAMYFDAWEAASCDGNADADRPLIAQLGGDDPQTMLRAARLLEPHVDAIDLNFGCPTEDARRGGSNSHSPKCRRFGAYLLDDVPLMERLVGTLAHGLGVPVTAKMRLLSDESRTLAAARAIESAGASALCVHGRTVRQRPKYADRDRTGAVGAAPSWAGIAAVAAAVDIPVIANGGIENLDDAKRCLVDTGAVAVMSAEALLERPDLFLGDVGDGDVGSTVARALRLAREFLDLAEAFPCNLEYPPTKSHLFKILHRLAGADQAEARRRVAAEQPLTLHQELKLILMRCPVHDFGALRRALDEIEARYQQAEPSPELGPSWYRRWRDLRASPKPRPVTAGAAKAARRTARHPARRRPRVIASS